MDDRELEHLQQQIVDLRTIVQALARVIGCPDLPGLVIAEDLPEEIDKLDLINEIQWLRREVGVLEERLAEK